MNNLLKFVQSATPGQSVQFRRKAYGKEGVRQFLRDVLAMANADVDGARYIITGAKVDENGRKKAHGISKHDFSGVPSYESLVTEFIEPPIRIRYRPVTISGKHVGAYVIADCQDKPYMMCIDQSEKLRRGDAYIRMRDMPVKMGRRQLQDMFERKFRDSVSADRIEIGFPGDIIEDASLSLVLPTHEAFHVARNLPKKLINGEYHNRSAAELADYPAVNIKDELVHVSNTLGDVPPHAPVRVFEIPMRICAGYALKGRKIGIRYSLFGSNLRKPARGQLRLIF